MCQMVTQALVNFVVRLFKKDPMLTDKSLATFVGLHVGESVISIPAVDVPVIDLVQYGDGVYSDTSFAWMRYPDNFIITVAISKPQLQPNAVVVRGFENSALRFHPYHVIYRTKRSFMANHKKFSLLSFLLLTSIQQNKPIQALKLSTIALGNSLYQLARHNKVIVA